MQSSLKWRASLKGVIYNSCFDLKRESILITHKRAVSELHRSDGSVLEDSRTYSSPTRCVSISEDGSMIAVGEAGGLVSIRARSGNIISTYMHTSAIRCISFHPSRHICVSGSEESIRLWVSDARSSVRIALPAACFCLSWSLCGNHFVYALVNGTVALVDHNKFDSNIWSIQLVCSVWCCTFLSSSEIIVGSWDPPLLHFFNASDGSSISRTSLPSNPTCMSRYSDHMVFVGDAQGYVKLYGKSSDRDFIPLVSIDSGTRTFISSIISTIPNFLVVTTFDGLVTLYNVRAYPILCSSDSFYCVRDSSCLSRFTLYTKFDDSSSSPTLINVPGIITGIGAWEKVIAVLVDDKSIHTFRVENSSSISSELKIEIPDYMSQGIKLVAPISDGVIIVHGLTLSFLTVDGKNKSIPILTPVESIKIISPHQFLLLTNSGDLILSTLTHFGLHKLCSIPCHGIKAFDMSFHKTCFSILEHSGDLLVFQRDAKKFSISSVIACEWNRTVDGLLLMRKSDETVHVWDRSTGRVWAVGKLAEKSLLKFDGNVLIYIQANGGTGRMIISMEKVILDISNQESRESLARAYHIALKCSRDIKVFDTLGKLSLKLGELKIAKICFTKSKNGRCLFLLSLPQTRVCPEGYLELLQGKIESGVRKLWTVNDETRRECIEVLVRFREWSSLLNIGGTECMRDALRVCDDRLAAGHGYMQLGDMTNAFSAFMSCAQNDLVMQCVTESNLEVAIEYFDTVNDWNRLEQLVLRTNDTERIARAYASRSRWDELQRLCDTNEAFIPLYLSQHGRYLVNAGTGVSKGLWEMIQSAMVSEEELSLKCREWAEKFARAGHYRQAACVSAIDPKSQRNHVVIYYAYSIVMDELSEKAPFAVHDADLVLNACLYLHNHGDELVRYILNPYEGERVMTLLVERLFECGCLFSARAVFESLESKQGLPAGVFSDLLSLCTNDLFCEDGSDYTIRCPTCSSCCPLLSPKDICQSCQRPFERELCLLDPVAMRKDSKHRESAREIVPSRDGAIIICSYCKCAFLFLKYSDDSKCMICDCSWYTTFEGCIQ